MFRANFGSFMSKLTGSTAIVLVAALLSPTLQAQDTSQLAERLIALRAEVEELNQELDLVKQEHRAEMSALSAQKSELAAQKNRLDTNIAQLEQKLNENKALAAKAGVDNEALNPVVLKAISDLRQHIAQGIPFKKDARISELDEIERQMNAGQLPANRAANRLWAFYEDELRLTRENGIYQQTIELDGERVLADVAKLGTIAMFYRTDDERYGAVERTGSGWAYRAVSEADQVAAIQGLFDALQKQIRQGYFELPLAALPQELQS